MMLCVMRVVLAAAALAHVDALRVTRKDAIVGAAASSLRPVLPRTAKAAAAAATTASSAAIAAATTATPARAAAATGTAARLRAVTDPATYTALAYAPPGKKKPPLVVVLHGAGENARDVWNLADIQGEHRGLAPSLLAAGAAPPSLAENFAVVAPYSAGRLSLYGDPRSKMLAFVDWVLSDAGRAAGCPDADPSRVFLFGFSDGATEAVELLTTRRFAGGVVCSYGFTGTLPAAAVSRLADVPVWAFHSADDAIFDVANSDRLVASLRRGGARDVVRYTRYDSDPENVAGSARGHTCGISASKLPEVYDWMLQIHAPG